MRKKGRGFGGGGGGTGGGRQGRECSTHHGAGVEHQDDDLDPRQAGPLREVAPQQLLGVREPPAVPHVRLGCVLLRRDLPLLGGGGGDAVIRGQEGRVAVGALDVLELHYIRKFPNNRFAWARKQTASQGGW